MLSVMWEMLKQRSYIVIFNVKRYFNCETLENMNYDVMTVSSYFTCGISHLFNWEILVFHHKAVNIYIVVNICIVTERLALKFIYENLSVQTYISIKHASYPKKSEDFEMDYL